MKNKNLYQYHLELEGMKSSVLYQLCFGRIKDFYKNNSIRINTLLEKLSDLQKEYFVFEDGKIKREGEPLEPTMELDKTYEEYMVKYNELMEKDCPILF